MLDKFIAPGAIVIRRDFIKSGERCDFDREESEKGVVKEATTCDALTGFPISSFLAHAVAPLSV